MMHIYLKDSWDIETVLVALREQIKRTPSRAARDHFIRIFNDINKQVGHKEELF